MAASPWRCQYSISKERSASRRLTNRSMTKPRRAVTGGAPCPCGSLGLRIPGYLPLRAIIPGAMIRCDAPPCRRRSARRSGSQQGVDADLRPGFELVAEVADAGQGEELGVGEAGLAGGDGGLFQVVEVDDAEVDAADRVGVVVDQADAADRAFAPDVHLL